MQRAVVRAMPWVFVLIWSTGFVVARLAMPHAPPFKVLAVRFALSALCYGVWIASARAAWPVGRGQWLHLAVTGALMQAGYLGGVWAAVKHGMGAGLVALSGPSAPDGSTLSRLQSELAMNEANLGSIASGAEALEYQLERLNDVLANAGEHFFITARHVRLDRMNVLLADEDPAPGASLDLQIVRVPLPDAAPDFRTFTFVRFPRAAMLPRTALVSEAARMLQ